MNAEWLDQQRMDWLRRNVLLAIMPLFFMSTGLRTNWQFGGARSSSWRQCCWLRRWPEN